MPAVSKKQQRFMGMVHAEQKGEDTGSAKAKQVAGSISKSDAKDFAETKHKGLPEKKGMIVPWARIKRALDEVSVRPPDVDGGTDSNVPNSQTREDEADCGRSTPAPDAAPDVRPDDSPQTQTVEKGASIPKPKKQKTPSTAVEDQIPPVPAAGEDVRLHAKVAWDELHPLDQVYLMSVKSACDARGVRLSKIIDPQLAWAVEKAATLGRRG